MLTDSELKQIFKNNKKQCQFLKIGKSGELAWNTCRWFTLIIYPEHWENKEDMINDIRSIGMPCSLSPLHDSDVTEDGEIKKPHYHLVLYWSGKTTPYRAYCSVCGGIGDNTFFGFQGGGNGNQLIRYHCHLDDPEKAPYNIKDIIDINNFKSGKYLKESMVSDVDTIREIKKVIKENNILFFNELDDILDENYPILYEEFSTNRNVSRQIKDYIKGREYQMYYDGEIIRSSTRFRNPDGSEKVIFNRELKQA